MLKRFFLWLKSLFSSKPKVHIGVDFGYENKSEEEVRKEKLAYTPYAMQKGNESRNQKVRNVEKHLRIARACHDLHEREVHIEKAEKLIKRYGFPPLDRTPSYA